MLGVPGDAGFHAMVEVLSNARGSGDARGPERCCWLRAMLGVLSDDRGP